MTVLGKIIRNTPDNIKPMHAVFYSVAGKEPSKGIDAPASVMYEVFPELRNIMVYEDGIGMVHLSSKIAYMWAKKYNNQEIADFVDEVLSNA